jgi:RNA polymerase sigma factor (sigma-70 family)
MLEEYPIIKCYYVRYRTDARNHGPLASKYGRVIRTYGFPPRIEARGAALRQQIDSSLPEQVSMTRTVFLIDDDSALHADLVDVRDMTEIGVSWYRNAEDFLDAAPAGQSGCVLAEIRLSGMSGLDLHATLLERDIRIPVIFLTAHADVPAAVRAMRAGAFDFLQKPIDSETLLHCLRAALVVEERRQMAAAQQRKLNLKLDRLTPRERAVLRLIASGRSNKQAAQYLRISHRTVEVYRARLMQKLALTNLLELAAFASACGMCSEEVDGATVSNVGIHAPPGRPRQPTRSASSSLPSAP